MPAGEPPWRVNQKSATGSKTCRHQQAAVRSGPQCAQSGRSAFVKTVVHDVFLDLPLAEGPITQAKREGFAQDNLLLETS